MCCSLWRSKAALLLHLLLLTIVLQQLVAVSHMEQNFGASPNELLAEEDYEAEPTLNRLWNTAKEDGKDFDFDKAKRSRIYMYRKKGCIPQGGACDNRMHECCFNSSCRCNLWGSNCRCQRMGLFQKWG